MVNIAKLARLDCGVTPLGFCRFEDVLPLRECKKKSKLPDDPKTVIVLLFPYFIGDFPERNVARYAIVDDYHRVAGNTLESVAAQLRAAFPDEEFVCFVDNSPIREVFAAAASGLGVIGRHGMLIHERFGSRVFIGEIVTTLELKPKPVEIRLCHDCGRCLAACPTGALRRDMPLNRERCRPFIAQKKHGLSDWEISEIKKGGLVWGCDICSDICPMNKDIPLSPISAFYDNVLPVLTSENLSRAVTEKPYGWLGEEFSLRNLHFILA